MFKIFIMSCLFFSWVKLEDQIYHVALSEDNSKILYWTINYNTKVIKFELHLPIIHNGWFGLGFSDWGNLFPADYCIFVKNGKHSKILDVKAKDNGALKVDKLQDCLFVGVKDVENVTKFAFERAFDTCDLNNYVIEDGTTHLVWVDGKGPLLDVDGYNISSTDGNHGMTRVTLLKNTHVDSKLPEFVENLDILVKDVPVPSEETTYWCSIYKLPKKFIHKHHIYQYEAHIPKTSEGVVHHMEVFHCIASAKDEITQYEGPCFSQHRPKRTEVCKKVLAAWAMGATPFIYPEESGLPLGGENFNPYLMIEVHYNNPAGISGLVDNSGIRFYISSKLKPMDAGVMELGLEYTDKMAIPPHQSEFSLQGYCISECTAAGLPLNGITVFGSQLHAHLTGAKIYTRHIRNGIELLELNRDNHFSTHFQEIRRLRRPVKVLPGDALITKCYYNSANRKNITFGGFSISDEMCVNYIHYFPATNLEVCKSSISDQALQTYFRYMNEWEAQDTSPLKGIQDNFKAINWNKVRVELLNEVYNEAPLSMQCNMSSGDRFPGYWKNAPLTQVLSPLQPSHRNC